jgi:hypothetical protein
VVHEQSDNAAKQKNNGRQNFRLMLIEGDNCRAMPAPASFVLATGHAFLFIVCLSRFDFIVCITKKLKMQIKNANSEKSFVMVF